MLDIETSDNDAMRDEVKKVREVLAASFKFGVEYGKVRVIIGRRANFCKELARAKKQLVDEDPIAPRAAKKEAVEALCLMSLKAVPKAIEKSTFAIFLQTMENRALSRSTPPCARTAGRRDVSSTMVYWWSIATTRISSMRFGTLSELWRRGCTTRSSL